MEADIAESRALYQHDSRPSGVTWVDGLLASVRPIITYAFFFLFSITKICMLVVLMAEQQLTFVVAIPEIWDAETQALFAACL